MTAGRGVAQRAKCGAALRSLLALAVSVAAVALVGYLGGAVTRPAIASGWYAALSKPGFTPPNWAFPVAWGLLYAMMAVAAWLAWRAGARRALWVYGGQLALNLAWSAAFFGLRSPGLGVVLIVALLVAILFTLRGFFPRSRWAGLLLLPYLGWVGYAAVLNVTIWRMNG